MQHQRLPQDASDEESFHFPENGEDEDEDDFDDPDFNPVFPANTESDKLFVQYDKRDEEEERRLYQRKTCLMLFLNRRLVMCVATATLFVVVLAAGAGRGSSPDVHTYSPSTTGSNEVIITQSPLSSLVVTLSPTTVPSPPTTLETDSPTPVTVAPSPLKGTTEVPTLLTTVAYTLAPTAPTNSILDEAERSPINRLGDPRYGPAEGPVFSQARLEYWRDFQLARMKLSADMATPEGLAALTKLYASSEIRVQHSQFCGTWNNQTAKLFPRLYTFPTLEDPPPKDRIKDNLKRVRQWRAALTEYRYGEPGGFARFLVLHTLFPKALTKGFLPVYDPDASPARKTVYEAALTRMARKFREAIEGPRRSVVIATMGSSVMSGQDNCFNLTYPQLLERTMRVLLEPLGVRVTVLSAGFNGDGPDSESQFMCYPDLFGKELDFIVGWYSMYGPPPQPMNEIFFQRLADRGVVWHDVGGMMLNLPPRFAEAGFATDFGWISTIPSQDRSLEHDGRWAPHHFWGQMDDEYCHTVTREGNPGVMMRNWHFGNLGFEYLVDLNVNMYAEAITRALVAIDAGKALPEPPPLDVAPRRSCPDSGTTSAQTTGTRTNSSSFSVSTMYDGFVCDPAQVKSNFRLTCLTAIHPQYASGFDLLYDGWLDGNTSNDYQLLRGSESIRRTRIKNPSYGPNDMANGGRCAPFPDWYDAPRYSHAFSSSGGPRDPMQFRFRLTQPAWEALGEKRRMNLALCESSHNGEKERPGWGVVFFVNGKQWAPPLEMLKPMFSVGCARLAHDVPVPATLEEARSTTYSFSFTYLPHANNASAPIPAFDYSIVSIVFAGI